MAIQTQQVSVRPRHRFTVEDYHCMIEAGILDEDDRAELLGGEVFEKMPMGSKHAGCITRLTQFLPAHLAGQALLRVQLPVTIPDFDEPEPDVLLARPRQDAYSESHPVPTDVLMIIEISDTSLAFDRTVKLAIYAQAGIPEYWVFDITGVGIERYTDPDPVAGIYRRATRVGRGESLASEVMPDLVFSVDVVLGLQKGDPS